MVVKFYKIGSSYFQYTLPWVTLQLNRITPSLVSSNVHQKAPPLHKIREDKQKINKDVVGAKKYLLRSSIFIWSNINKRISKVNVICVATPRHITDIEGFLCWKRSLVYSHP
jgi:hypothetical protein